MLFSCHKQMQSYDIPGTYKYVEYLTGCTKCHRGLKLIMRCISVNASCNYSPIIYWFRFSYIKNSGTLEPFFQNCHICTIILATKKDLAAKPKICLSFFFYFLFF